MNQLNNIKTIGFDLDQTLYPKSPKIDKAIQEYIYHKIAGFKHCSFEEARDLFYKYYPGISGRKTLIKLGVPNAEGIVQEALENADIVEFLSPNQEVIGLLNELKQRYGSLTLITGSRNQNALKKLNSLNISPELFDHIITGLISKSEGDAYKKWMQEYPLLKPENFLYVGDRKTTDVDVPVSLGMQAVLVNVKEKDNSVDVHQFSSLVEIRSVLLSQKSI